MHARALLLIASAAVLAGCSGADAVRSERCEPGSVPTVAGDTVVTESGLRYVDRVVGTGIEAEMTSIVEVHYTGYLLSDTIFDTTRGRSPAEIPLRGVVQGFAEGIAGMRIGGSRILIIPPALGYRDQPVGCIPPGSTLIFDVELLGVRPGA